MDINSPTVTPADRQDALALLHEHYEAGRLHSFEYEDRRGRVTDAASHFDLQQALADLPPTEATSPTAGFPSDHARSADPASRGNCLGSRGLLGSGAAYTWVPLLATALFFITRSWVWFLLIPAASCLVSSGSVSRSSRRGRGAGRRA